MGALMERNLADSANLIERARDGDREALNSLLDQLSRPTAPHGGDSPRHPPAGAARRLGRDPGGVRRGCRAAGRSICAIRSYPLFLWLRLVVGERLMKLHRHHLGTQMRDAGREVSLFRGAVAGGQLGGAGGAVAGQAHLADPGGRARRTDPPLAGGAQRPRADRPRGPVAATLRGADRGRDGSGPGHRGVGRRQALLPRSQDVSRRSSPTCPAGRKGSDMAGDSSERLVLLNHLADEFAERYRRGERPALQEYIDRHPGAGRRHPRVLPGHGRDGAGQGRSRGGHRAADRPAGCRRQGAWAIIGSSARSAAAAWASSTRPSRCRWAGTWR